tara:strand:+ start:2330 stop:2512 length:183 start_codon:yes stop_codon:yes gene_type:complete
MYRPIKPDPPKIVTSFAILYSKSGIEIVVYSANNWLASLADAFNGGECLNLKGTLKQIKV